MNTAIKHLSIITGASRGMGEAIALQLLAPDRLVLGISRGQSQALQQRAAELGAPEQFLLQWQADLSEPLPVAERLRDWLIAQAPAGIASLELINNAALLSPPGPVDARPLAELSAALRVSLEATLLLSAAVLEATADWSCPRRVLNISSGLGRRAMAGSAGYCAAKAGMDNLSRAMALDEAHKQAQGRPAAQVVSLAPGIIDTDMQVQLRSADAAQFPDQAVFAGFKQAGQLSSPAEAAARVLAVLRRPDFGSQVLADVREA
ncbi:SDR family NAD(P)-dependent oxidoreductase [Paucibacter sp. APW11]|uniref:SDR family NAD(P)-dependent oxidoreductase n=1 Tax=Roseateles aquae TaxID=3077235 RepID=A0ABU3P8Z1_9BURK|nr:SDR family NAD(P)-dependent oxidoreductase [Paucibacter sp. APW11]MDT8999039.1 SDR family NAD(P)-dependent oxidoreductase [Paucibacter sp. APW11]